MTKVEYELSLCIMNGFSPRTRDTDRLTVLLHFHFYIYAHKGASSEIAWSKTISRVEDELGYSDLLILCWEIVKEYKCSYSREFIYYNYYQFFFTLTIFKFRGKIIQNFLRFISNYWRHEKIYESTFKNLFIIFKYTYNI